jgi:hypothetical protein
MGAAPVEYCGLSNGRALRQSCEQMCADESASEGDRISTCRFLCVITRLSGQDSQILRLVSWYLWVVVIRGSPGLKSQVIGMAFLCAYRGFTWVLYRVQVIRGRPEDGLWRSVETFLLGF